MEQKDIVFEPHNDMSAEDIEIVNQHKNLIGTGNYSDATTLLDNNNYQKGFRASLFNSIQNRLRSVQEYLLNQFVAEDDEYYSYEEPTAEFMEENNYIWWIQPY